MWIGYSRGDGLLEYDGTAIDCGPRALDAGATITCRPLGRVQRAGVASSPAIA
jgi:hypothetical protein